MTMQASPLPPLPPPPPPLPPILFVPGLSPPQLSVNKLFIKQTVGMIFFFLICLNNFFLPSSSSSFVFYPHSLLHLSAYLFISYFIFISDAASPSPRYPFGTHTNTQACTLQISILNGFHIETCYNIHFQSLHSVINPTPTHTHVHAATEHAALSSLTYILWHILPMI